jgi:hypothetical protein
MDNQSTLEQSIFKERSVCVINLLALLKENNNITNIVMSSLCIDFNQTMMRIYFDFFVGGIIPIIF